MSQSVRKEFFHFETVYGWMTVFLRKGIKVMCARIDWVFARVEHGRSSNNLYVRLSIKKAKSTNNFLRQREFGSGDNDSSRYGSRQNVSGK